MKNPNKISWLFILALLIPFFCVATTEVTGSVNLQRSMDDPAIQMRAGGHLLAFKQDRVYLVGIGYALIEEFVGGARPIPILEDSPEINSTEVSKIKTVILKNLWEGITLKYGVLEKGHYESIFIVNPKANPSEIRLRYNMPASIQIDGSLRLQRLSMPGYLTQSAPIAWQEINGNRVPVSVSFNITKDQTVGFEVKQYNNNYPLIIDPTYQWHSFYGSSNEDKVYGITLDKDGNIYITGSCAQLTGFPDPIHQGGPDKLFIMKLNNSGQYLWHTYYGSIKGDHSFGIVVDTNSDVYVVGDSQGSWLGDSNGDGIDDKPPIHPYSENYDIVVLRLNTNGQYQWHTFYGSIYEDHAHAIAIDKDDNLYITGYCWASWRGDSNGDGVGDTDPIHPHNGIEHNGLVLKLNKNGDYQWHTYYGWIGRAISVDKNGNVYVASIEQNSWKGDLNGDGIDETNPIRPFVSGRGRYIAILKLTTNGQYQWHTFYETGNTGGHGSDWGLAIANDDFGNLYFVSNFF